MRGPLIRIGMICAAVLAVVAGRAQSDGLQPYFWPQRTVGIPVNVEQIARLQPAPTHLQLYYAVNRGTFQKGPRLPVDQLHLLDGGKRGFLFTAERDGDFEFSVQLVYADGSVSPRPEELSPQQRIIIDTTPPQVRIFASGSSVEWQASDEYLDPRGVQLQCRWPTSREWTTVTERPFRAADRYVWQLPPGKVLEVRVLARDRAGNTGISPLVRLPADGAAPAAWPRTGSAPDWLGGNRNLPTPRIDYVNSLKFDVEFSIQKMGRSGVKTVHLFVLKNSGGWEYAKKVDVHLQPGDRDRPLTIPFEVREEGTYGFYVVPESGAGKRADDPRADDPPMLYVVVDTTPPYIQITGVQVRPGSRGPLVEITWECADPNLMPQPVSLEWSLDRTASKWNEIKYRLDNLSNGVGGGRSTGRYVWEVPDESIWKFWIRARAVDKASNVSEHIWPQEVIVDLEKPEATINRVRGSSGGTSGGNAPGSGQPQGQPGSGPPPRGTLPSGSTLPPAGMTPPAGTPPPVAEPPPTPSDSAAPPTAGPLRPPPSVPLPTEPTPPPSLPGSGG